LITALYVAGDDYIDSDAVFGARDSLVVQYQPYSGGSEKIDSIEFNFTLAPS